MAFSLTRPPSCEGHISVQGQDDDYLSSALHAALSGVAPGSSAHPDLHHDMTKEKERAGIDIAVDSDCLLLKGTGVDVEPVLLKGHIVLHLTEPTSIKQITLQFRGKAKLPQPSSEAMPLSTSQQWYTICNHEWSFLEGEKRHSHTLKAGCHQFPFQLQLGGSLPSSITSSVYGGAHVGYKLRAVAVRPGLAHNMQAVLPISIVRTFAAEALEYQQSLEIENTWPDKLMYSIMIPHKAWAAGDELTAIVKFSPLSKGVHVLAVTTTVHETTKMPCRSGVQEHTRSVVTVHHEVPNGASEHHASPYGSSSVAPGLSRSQSFGSLSHQDEPHSSMAAPPPPSSDLSAWEAEPVASSSMPEQEIRMSENDVVAQLTLFIPKSVTPSHPLEPIMVSHRIRWSILMSNLDGHTSELRCSLPLHILDARLLDEARANTAPTRRLLLEGPEAPIDEELDTELPSYSAHVRDRVANMYLPDSATTRVLNPWIHSSVSLTSTSEHQSLSSDCPLSGSASPLVSHLPQPETGTPLDWVDSELLLLSLSNPCPHAHSPESTSRASSGPVSRRGSRAPSPDRHLTTTTTTTALTLYPLPVPPCHETCVHDGHASRSLPGLFSIQMKPHTSLTSPGWLSSRSNSHSNLASLADAGMGMGPGPGTGMGVSMGMGMGMGMGYGHGHRAATYAARPSAPVPGSQMPTPTPAAAAAMGTGGESLLLPESALWLPHRAFTEVPDYDVASRGFIGGVTPLTSLRGLPSYEEAERGGAACVRARGGGAVDGGDEGRVTVRRRPWRA